MRLRNWTTLCFFTLAGICGATTAQAATNQAVDVLFATPKVLALKLEVAPNLLDSLRREPKTYVKGTVREGEKTYANVGIRLKGASSVKLIDKKPSFAIKFDEFEIDQYFYGYTKILLNNSLSDPSYLSEAIGGEIFREAGVPAAKVTFARVDLNGRDLGLYVLTQAPNRDFLSDYFKKTKGNFYESDGADVNEPLQLNSGSGPKEQADLKSLVIAAREADQGQRLKKLGAVLDLERFISFLAMEEITWHYRGYMMDRDNYRVYHDPVSGQMVFVADGLDTLFSKPNGPLMPECKGLLARAVLETGEGRRLYRDRIAKLLPTVLKEDTLHARINELTGKIRPAAARDGNEAKAFETAVAQLREVIAQRSRFLQEELKKPAR